MRFTCTNFTSQNNTLFVDQWNAQAQKRELPFKSTIRDIALPSPPRCHPQQTAYNCITLLNWQHDTKRHGKPFKRYRTANNLSAINSRRAEELSQFAYFRWERASEILVLSDRRHKQKWNSFRIYDLARLRWHDIFTPVGGSDGWAGGVAAAASMFWFCRHHPQHNREQTLSETRLWRLWMKCRPFTISLLPPSLFPFGKGYEPQRETETSQWADIVKHLIKF